MCCFCPATVGGRLECDQSNGDVTFSYFHIPCNHVIVIHVSAQELLLLHASAPSTSPHPDPGPGVSQYPLPSTAHTLALVVTVSTHCSGVAHQSALGPGGGGVAAQLLCTKTKLSDQEPGTIPWPGTLAWLMLKLQCLLSDQWKLAQMWRLWVRYTSTTSSSSSHLVTAQQVHWAAVITPHLTLASTVTVQCSDVTQNQNRVFLLKTVIVIK